MEDKASGSMIGKKIKWLAENMAWEQGTILDKVRNETQSHTAVDEYLVETETGVQLVRPGWIQEIIS